MREQGSEVNCEAACLERGLSPPGGLDLAGNPPSVPRELRSTAGSQLSYGLFLDAPLTLTWGDGSGGTYPMTDAIELKGNERAVTRSYMLYGQVDGGQQGDAGRYLDAVAVRLRYTTSCK